MRPTREFNAHMGPALTQDTRLGELKTPLGKDVLVFVGYEASEGLSELFEYRIECLSEEADLDFDRAIGQQCTVKMKLYMRRSASSAASWSKRNGSA